MSVKNIFLTSFPLSIWAWPPSSLTIFWYILFCWHLFFPNHTYNFEVDECLADTKIRESVHWVFRELHKNDSKMLKFCTEMQRNSTLRKEFKPRFLHQEGLVSHPRRQPNAGRNFRLDSLNYWKTFIEIRYLRLFV